MIPESAFGHGDFMMIRAELVKVTGGPGQALLAALIFWRARPGSPYAYEKDGAWWWNASQVELAEATGMTRDAVQTAGKKLAELGMVEAARHQRAGIQDRSFSYRVITDTPIAPSGAVDSAEQRHVDSAERRDLPSIKTVKTTTTARARQLPSDLEWNTAHSVKAMARHVDVEVEFEKFKDYHLARASKFVDWDRAFHTWLNNARPEPGSSPGRVATRGPGPRTPTDRMQEIMAIRDPREMGMIE